MTLDQLSAAATQGEWCVDPVRGWVFTKPKPLITYVIANMESGDVDANAAFICQLVNLYRTGQLVAVSDDTVERVANAISSADLDGPEPEEYWKSLAIAAIAAMKDTQPALAAKGTGGE